MLGVKKLTKIYHLTSKNKKDDKEVVALKVLLLISLIKIPDFILASFLPVYQLPRNTN